MPCGKSDETSHQKAERDMERAKVTLYVSGLCMIIVSLMACQKSPEQELVQGKNDGQLESAIYQGQESRSDSELIDGGGCPALGGGSDRCKRLL